jgi:hypothetical protein
VAAAPAFAATPKIGRASWSSANTNQDGTGTLQDVITGGSSGTKVTSIVVLGTGDLADSKVNIFFTDSAGANPVLFDSFDLGNPGASSTTTDIYRATKAYADLVLPSGVKIQATLTVAPTSGNAVVWALGGDL